MVLKYDITQYADNQKHMYLCTKGVNMAIGILNYLNSHYRSGTLNSNMVNSKFHLIRSFFEIFARFLPFHV